jgi:hypothetical protein
MSVCMLRLLFPLIVHVLYHGDRVCVCVCICSMTLKVCFCVCMLYHGESVCVHVCEHLLTVTVGSMRSMRWGIIFFFFLGYV